MKLGQAAAVALALFAASPGAAQEAGTDRILAQMPKQLGGAPVLKMPNDIMMYFVPGPGGDAMVVGVSVVEKEGVFSPAQMRSFVREMAGIRQIVREGTFTTPKWPGAATFFGEYVTDEYLHQRWLVMTGKQTISVLATYEKKRDAKPVEGLVAENIFGGALISAAKPAEQK